MLQILSIGQIHRYLSEMKEVKDKSYSPTLDFVQAVASFSETVQSVASGVMACDLVLVSAIDYLYYRPEPLSCPLFVVGPTDSIQECLSLGCTDYLREPLSIDELVARFQRWSDVTVRKLITPGRLAGDYLHGPTGSVAMRPSLKRLLELFVVNHGMVIPRQAICICLGQTRSEGRGIDMQVSRLRNLLRSVGLDNIATELRSISGGYSFVS